MQDQLGSTGFDDKFVCLQHCLSAYPQLSLFPVYPSLEELVLIQRKLMQELAAQSTVISEIIQRIDRRCEGRSSTEEGGEYRTRLVLEGKLPCPVLKERGFALSGSVRNLDGQVDTESQGLSLGIALYAHDNPSRALTHNIAGAAHLGKKILRGTTTATVQSTGYFTFPNLVVTEVSSHYLDDAFTIVVSAHQCEVKELTIRKLVVRARKAKAAYMTEE